MIIVSIIQVDIYIYIYLFMKNVETIYRCTIFFLLDIEGNGF